MAPGTHLTASPVAAPEYLLCISCLVPAAALYALCGNQAPPDQITHAE